MSGDHAAARAGEGQFRIDRGELAEPALNVAGGCRCARSRTRSHRATRRACASDGSPRCGCWTGSLTRNRRAFPRLSGARCRVEPGRGGLRPSPSVRPARRTGRVLTATLDEHEGVIGPDDDRLRLGTGAVLRARQDLRPVVRRHSDGLVVRVTRWAAPWRLGRHREDEPAVGGRGRARNVAGISRFGRSGGAPAVSTLIACQGVRPVAAPVGSASRMPCSSWRR